MKNADREYYYDSNLYYIWQFPIEEEGIKIKTFPLMIEDPHRHFSVTM